MTTYTVTNTNNTGPGSLIEAFTNANANSGSTVNIIISGTFEPQTTLAFLVNMTIINTSGGLVTISGSNSRCVFDLSGTGTIVSISNITITLGRNVLGGGIYITNDNILTIEKCIIDNNTAINSGGGIYQYENSKLTINNSIITSNFNNGIYIGSNSLGSDFNLIVNNCTFSYNYANFGAGIEIQGRGNCLITNSSFIENTADGGPFGLDTGSGIMCQSFGTNRIINCTFYGNHGTAANNAYGTNIYIGCTMSKNTHALTCFEVLSGTTSIGNCVIADNPFPGVPDARVIDGTLISLGNNFIGNASDILSSMKSSDIYGINNNPRNPLLLPLTNNGGPTETMMPQTIPKSGLINNGSVTLVNDYYIYPQLLSNGNPIDQRGYQKIVNSLTDIGSTQSSSVACFSGDSLVMINNINTNIIEYLSAKNIDEKIHQVFDTINNCFIDIERMIISGPVIRFWEISKNLLAENVPFETFHVTGGHNLSIDGKIVKARDIVGAKRIKTASQNTYTICTKYETAILVNGLNVMTWSIDKFTEYARTHNIIFT